MAKRLKEKTAKRQANADKRPFAIAKYVRISPSKIGVVLDLVRGQKYGDAVAILENVPKAGSEIVKKVLNSAAANAEHNVGLSKVDLYVAEAFAGPGPTLKRMMPRAKGSADRILKRTSHVTIILDSEIGK
ncbi:MAG: 50S ribosomal protein L22 [Clostridiales bacterium]|jgi:large subunit ribosomal protein L22|nr:50S ribosomal protein L22 [Clostridiales bacterium]